MEVVEVCGVSDVDEAGADELRGRRTPDELVMHHGVFQVMTLIAPYLAESYLYLYEQAYSLYKEVSGQ